ETALADQRDVEGGGRAGVEARVERVDVSEVAAADEAEVGDAVEHEGVRIVGRPVRKGRDVAAGGHGDLSAGRVDLEAGDPKAVGDQQRSTAARRGGQGDLRSCVDGGGRRSGNERARLHGPELDVAANEE